MSQLTCAKIYFVRPLSRKTGFGSLQRKAHDFRCTPFSLKVQLSLIFIWKEQISDDLRLFLQIFCECKC